MGTYPFWSLNFDMRPDVAPAVHRVLTAVARDTAADADDLKQLHPVPRYYLTDWRRLLTDEAEPMVGSPVRLTSDRRYEAPARVLSIEFSQHDDEYADGGWVFWLWVLRLVARPMSPSRAVIGYHGLYRGDSDTKLIRIDPDGIEQYGVRVSFEEVDSFWEDLKADDYWTHWHP